MTKLPWPKRSHSNELGAAGGGGGERQAFAGVDRVRPAGGHRRDRLRGSVDLYVQLGTARFGEGGSVAVTQTLLHTPARVGVRGRRGIAGQRAARAVAPVDRPAGDAVIHARDFLPEKVIV